MEQSRGSNIPLVQAAGLDPAYVPGIVAPEADGDHDREQVVAADTDGASDHAADVATGPGPAPAAAAEESADDVEVTENAGDGPVFEAVDRRGTIRADQDGVTFRLDDTEAEFDWDEIAAVEVDIPKWGRRFGVTVYLSPRRWFGTWVDAPNRSRLRAWSEEFDAVLDVCFDQTTGDGADTEKRDSVAD
ncbi:hypothetical protein [Streptomyces sp. NPDC026673]|uniref:hypothetical protein n=1 Tax=Streptomyces sp. NPDC026673 TaxID=3155724 RepID=UPI00340EE6F6